MMPGTFNHIPVLLDEVVGVFRDNVPHARRIIDGTVGGGSHAAALLEALPEAELIGIDRDAEALAAAGMRLSGFGDRVHLARANYSEMFKVAADHGWDKVDGVLLDLGVSSHQLDVPERGFSWRADGPLDMRMDDRSELTAARVLNRYSQEELYRVFSQYGEFKGAGRLASFIVKTRETTPYSTTNDLVKSCDEVLGRSPKGKLPAPTLVFQALRIEVNDELGELKRFLEDMLAHVDAGGVVTVISFQSLEDRMVKDFFRTESTQCLCPPGLPECRCGHAAALRTITRKPVMAGDDESRSNPRCRCAKLRAATRI